MRQVVWSATASDHLDLIRLHIEQNAGPRAAELFVGKLSAAGDSLVEMPDRGRPTGGGARELAVIPPYLIRYRVLDERVIILRVRHGARRPL